MRTSNDIVAAEVGHHSRPVLIRTLFASAAPGTDVFSDLRKDLRGDASQERGVRRDTEEEGVEADFGCEVREEPDPGLGRA